MITIVATLDIKEGKEEEFEAVMKGLADEVRKNEDGCALYTVNKTKDGKYVMLERYNDKDAFKAHTGSEHFKEASPKIMACMGGLPTMTRLEEIF